MQRIHQWILIAATLLGSWLGMQLVHEFGHVLGLWATGGRVAKVVFHPLTISRTDPDPAANPRPLAVVWAGPLLGVALPVLAWLAAAVVRLSGAYLPRFFAGFCLIANGAYIGAGSFDRVGDCGEMVRHGSPVWLLWLFGAVTVPAGLGLWHRLGPHFGLGSARGRVSARAAYVSLACFVVLAAVGFTFGGE
jgi:hypothetical protein